MKDHFALLWRIVFEVVELLYAFSVALERLRARKQPKMFGIGAEFVFEGVTHPDI